MKGDRSPFTGLIRCPGEKLGVVKAVLYGLFEAGTEYGIVTLL
jgi:hypothetical protein